MAKSPANKDKKPMSDDVKAALIEGGTKAGGGFLQGLATAFLTPEQKDPSGHAALPAGSPGSVKGTAGGQMSFANPNLPDRKSYALEMLAGGYK